MSLIDICIHPPWIWFMLGFWGLIDVQVWAMALGVGHIMQPID
jgi:hypothetical protein